MSWMAKGKLLSSLVLLTICAAVFAAEAQSQNAATPAERLRKAAILSALDTDDMKPWHLAMTFELFDEKGRSSQSGTVEEWWASSSTNKITYTTSNASWTQIRTKDGVFRSKGTYDPPGAAELLLQLVTHPVQAGQVNRDLQTFGLTQTNQGQLDCLTMTKVDSRSGKAKRAERRDQAFWLEHEKGSLRGNSLFGVGVSSRDILGTFAGKSLPIDQTISFEGQRVGKSHVTMLKFETFAEPEFLPDTTFVRLADELRFGYVASANKFKGHIGNRYAANFPEGARLSKVPGVVVLLSTIGPDGHLVSLLPVYSNRKDFIETTIEASKQWTFDQEHEDGKAMAFEQYEVTIFRIEPTAD